MPRRLLFFSPFFSPSNYPEAIVTGKLVLALQERGWKVDVIAEPIGAQAADRSAVWESLSDCTHTTEIHPARSAKMLIEKSRAIFQFGYPVSGVGWARQALKIGSRLAQRHDYDAMISRSRPVSAHLPAMLLRSRTNIPWIASWNDPPNRDPIPYGPGPSGRAPFFQNRAVKRSANLADCNLFCSERLRDYSIALYPEMARRSHVIPHLGVAGAASPFVDPAKFTILHIGSLDGARDPRIFLAGLDQFLARGSAEQRAKVSVHFVGAHRIESQLQQLATPLVRAAMHVEPWCDYEESLRRIASATVLLMIEAPMPEGVLLLAKLADYAVSGRPILAVSPAVGSAADVFRKYGGGVVADNRSAAAVTENLNLLFNSWERGKLEIDFDKENISTYFSADSIVDEFEKMIAGLHSPTRADVATPQLSSVAQG